MKRRDLVRHLTGQGCKLLREGAKHSVYVNPKNNFTSTVPRHREVDDFLARKICRDLSVRLPK
ncbi:MAG TPA: type II toxin-antitoxin system HicA family toxin [Terriglobia bacterium]|nr:type II toxin-antitoxin system HicA family toxin [Terriglobia bacterium]